LVSVVSPSNSSVPMAIISAFGILGWIIQHGQVVSSNYAGEMDPCRNLQHSSVEEMTINRFEPLPTGWHRSLFISYEY
jgi:hypothetical protein